MTRTLQLTVIFAAAALLVPVTARAEVTHSVSLIGPALQVGGDASVGNRSVAVDVAVDELIDKLEIGGVLDYRAEAPKWSFMAEGAFVGLGDSSHGLSMDVDLTLVELDGGYRFNEIAEVFLGVRYTELSAALEGTGPTGARIDVENDDDFFDPIVGLRFATPLSDSGKWRVQGRGDVGGFGVGMDLEWQAVLDFGYRPSETWAIWLGYRALAQDFDGAGKDDRFAMDVIYQGPQLGVSWTF